MFGWRRKTDGFDWHKHVRTTIKVRRDLRRERIDLAKDAAAQKAQGAARATGNGLVRVFAASRTGLAGGFAWLGHVLTPLGAWLTRGTRTLLTRMTAPTIAVPLAIAGSSALIAATIEIATRGFTRDVLTPLALGTLLVLFVLPTLEGLFAKGEREIKALPFVIAIGLIGSGSATAYYALRDELPSAKPRAATVPTADLKPLGNATIATKTAPQTATATLLAGPGLTGSAQALDGATLRIDGRLVRLVGVESPARGQRCQTADNRPWRCGEVARSELGRLVRNKPVVCKAADVRGTLEVSIPLGTCVVEGRDLSADLVRGGHVFLTRQAPAMLNAIEAEAKRAKAGLWKGAAETPEAYRAKVWEQAKARAPEACPIKGQVTGLGRTYLMPWASDYGKARVQKSRGDRWFCSEADAKSAGWEPAPPG